jgi:tetratricopeptide (TPR) repeat protein
MTKIEKTICTGCFLLILIHLLASFSPQQRLWGLNLLYYLPGLWRWLLVVLGFLVLIPLVNRGVGDLVGGFSGWISRKLKKIHRYYLYAFVSLLCGLLFWLFRVKTYLLGDSFLRAREINQGLKFSFTAPLDFLIHLGVVKVLGWDAFFTYAVLSVLGGVMFLFLVFLLGDILGRDGRERSLIFLVILCMGATQLFFGYVESYTLLYVALTAYLFFSLGYLMGRSGLVFPVLSFLLCLGLHLSALSLFPSLLYLIFAKRRGVDLYRVLLSFGLVILVGLGLFLLSSYDPETRGLSYFLIHPLGAGEGFYSLFSGSHLLDIINHQLLVSPVGLLLLLTGLLVFPKRSSRDDAIGFLILVSVCTLGYALVVDPKLGYARDWDLFAFSGLGYTFLGLYVFLRHVKGVSKESLRYLTISLVFTSLVSTIPLIYVNSTETKAMARFEHLLDLDKRRSPSGRETLAIHYNMQGEREKEIEQWRKAIAFTQNARYINNLASVYYEMQRYDLALRYLDRSLEVDSVYHYTHFSRGEVLIHLGRYEEAISEFKRAIKLKPDRIEYYRNLGANLANLGRNREAIEVLQEGLRADPDYFPFYRDLGYTHYNLGDYAQAEKYLKLYLDNLPQAEDQAQARQILEKARQGLHHNR